VIVVIFIEYEVRVVLHIDHQVPDVVKESGDDQLVTRARGLGQRGTLQGVFVLSDSLAVGLVALLSIEGEELVHTVWYVHGPSPRSLVYANARSES
jgi:hypothetical protein